MREPVKPGYIQSMTTTTPDMSLLETLQDRFYDPQDTAGRYGEWFDFTASGTGTVRVVIFPDDDFSVQIYKFDRHMAEQWGVRFTPGTPDAVIIAALDAAETQLAAEHGGKLR